MVPSAAASEPASAETEPPPGVGSDDATEQFLGRCYRKMRKFGTAMWMISQKLNDFLGSRIGREAILGNSTIRLFLRHQKGNYGPVIDHFGLSARAAAAFRGLDMKPGHYSDILLMYGAHTSVVRLALSPLAYWILTTDKADKDFLARAAEKNPLLDRREFVFGTVRAGERRSWTVPVKLPPGMDTRRDEVTLHFADDAGKAPPDVTTAVGVVEQQKPVFSFSVSLNDAKGGNGDGLPQRGETFELRVDVKNSGTGAAGDKTYVAVKNLGDEKLFIKRGREVIGALKPGEVKSATIEVELRKGSKSETLPLRVLIADEKMQEYVAEKLDLTVAKDEPARTVAKGSVKVEGAEALLRTGASASAPVIAAAHRGAVLPVDAHLGEFYRVEWQKGRFAFVADGDVKAARGARAGTVTPLWQREPPRIALTPDPLRGAPVVEADTWKLQGSASVPASADPGARLRDVFVFVNDQKVFFKVQPEKAATPKMDFSADIPLKPGNNVVTVVAREDEEFQTRRSVVVYRRAQAEVAAEAGRGQKPTP